MIIDTKKLQKAVIENKKKHNFNNTDVKFEKTKKISMKSWLM